MEMNLNNPVIEKYISTLLKLDDKSKREVIERLLRSFNLKNDYTSNTLQEDSLKETREPYHNLKKSFGFWKDERSSEEIIKEIYDARIDKEFNENMFE